MHHEIFEEKFIIFVFSLEYYYIFFFYKKYLFKYCRVPISTRDDFFTVLVTIHIDQPNIKYKLLLKMNELSNLELVF
jgi:hypothetical protein